MGTDKCYHYSKESFDDSDTRRYCKDCGLIFNTEKVWSGSIEIGKLTSLFKVPQNTLSLGNLIADTIGGRVTVIDVVVSNEENYWRDVTSVVFTMLNSKESLVAQISNMTRRDDYVETSEFVNLEEVAQVAE